MNLSEIKTRVYFLTGSDANSYPAADFLINLNIWNDRITGWSIRKSGTWRYDDRNQDKENRPVASLVSGQRAYALPIDIKNLRRVQVSYDGINVYRATLLNENEVEGELDDDNHYNPQSPRYVIRGDFIEIYPKPSQDVTDGLMLDIDRDAYKFTSDDLTAGTKTPGYSREFHDLLATGVALEWAKSKRKEVAPDLLNDVQNYISDLGLELADRNKEEDIALQAGLANYN